MEVTRTSVLLRRGAEAVGGGEGPLKNTAGWGLGTSGFFGLGLHDCHDTLDA